MLPPHHKILEIIENAQFADELKEIESDSLRADEFMEGAIQVLCRKPTLGTLTGKNVWFLPMVGGKVVLYYTFDDDHVYLLSIQVASTRHGQEE
jgi:hypothetical protein